MKSKLSGQTNLVRRFKVCCEVTQRDFWSWNIK